LGHEWATKLALDEDVGAAHTSLVDDRSSTDKHATTLTAAFSTVIREALERAPSVLGEFSLVGDCPRAADYPHGRVPGEEDV
jgi:hypothetical protein